MPNTIKKDSAYILDKIAVHCKNEEDQAEAAFNLIQQKPGNAFKELGVDMSDPKFRKTRKNGCGKYYKSLQNMKRWTVAVVREQIALLPADAAQEQAPPLAPPPPTTTTNVDPPVGGGGGGDDEQIDSLSQQVANHVSLSQQPTNNVTVVIVNNNITNNIHNITNVTNDSNNNIIISNTTNDAVNNLNNDSSTVDAMNNSEREEAGNA
jgi:hypothetical protein